MAVGYGFTIAGTVALIFLAPLAPGRTFLLSGALLLIFAAHFVLLLAWFAGRNRDDAYLSFLRGTGPAFAAISLQAIFIFAPFYFSDDAIRHIFDGVFMLKGVDVYSIPPLQLGGVAGLMPNHPHLPTIYLPATQSQAMLGALISERYGFLLIYHFFCALMIAAIFHLMRGRGHERARLLFAALIFSPFFLIASASRHADVQGLLLALLCLAIIERGALPRAGAALMGFSAALLPGLKPEGLLWFAGLAVLVLSRTPAEGRLRFLFAWALGALPAALLQAIFMRLYMFPTSEALQGFRSTVVIFSNWFTAYNPFIALRSGAGSLDMAIREYRGIAWSVFGILLLAYPGRVLWKARRPDVRLEWKESVVAVLLLLLGAVIMSRAVWNPWYFLWFLPGLYLLGRIRPAAGLLLILPLFYLPVIQLRARGDWDFSTFIPFYFFAALAALLWFLLTGMGANPLIRRIWHPDKNHP